MSTAVVLHNYARTTLRWQIGDNWLTGTHVHKTVKATKQLKINEFKGAYFKKKPGF
jgi:hypothetical protein